MEIKKELEEIGGENGWELGADEEAVLEAAWAKERTPEFLVRMARQAAEDEEMLAEYRRKHGIKVVEIGE